MPSYAPLSCSACIALRNSHCLARRNSSSEMVPGACSAARCPSSTLAINVCVLGIIATEVVEDIIVLLPVLPNNDAIIALVLSSIAFDVNIEVFIAHVLTIVTFIVRALVIEGSIEAITVDPTYDLLRAVYGHACLCSRSRPGADVAGVWPL